MFVDPACVRCITVGWLPMTEPRVPFTPSGIPRQVDVVHAPRIRGYTARKTRQIGVRARIIRTADVGSLVQCVQADATRACYTRVRAIGTDDMKIWTVMLETVDLGDQFVWQTVK